MLMLVALSAIVLPLLLLVILRLPARVGMPIAAIIVGLLSFWFWKMDAMAMLASVIQGAHRAVTIGWILFGALFFLYAMQASGFLQTIRSGFSKASPDMRVQTVLIAFLFVSLIEGVAGFGTPAAIAVPLLIALGFRPLVAVILALTGDSVAVSFGAIGTPIFVGLENVPGASTAFFSQIAKSLTILDFAVAALMPTILVGLLLMLSKRQGQLTRLREIAPWTVFIGLTYALTTFALARLVGPAFISIIASIITLAIAMLTVKKRFLIPMRTWSEVSTRPSEIKPVRSKEYSLLYAWAPYIVIVALLVLQRTIPAVAAWSSSLLDLSLRNVLGFETINSLWPILMSPGTILLIVGILTLIGASVHHEHYRKAVAHPLKSTAIALSALVPTLIMIQLFANSGINSLNLPAMPAYIAAVLAANAGFLWVVLSPALGALTAFITGSSTISTLTMSPIQYSAALDLGLPVTQVLSQQISGANAGNMIAIHNVVAALTAAKLHHQEWRVIRVALIPMAIYLTLSIISAIAIAYFLA